MRTRAKPIDDDFIAADAWRMGRKARDRKLPIEANPFDRDPLALWWEAGWTRHDERARVGDTIGAKGALARTRRLGRSCEWRQAPAYGTLPERRPSPPPCPLHGLPRQHQFTFPAPCPKSQRGMPRIPDVHPWPALVGKPRRPTTSALTQEPQMITGIVLAIVLLTATAAPAGAATIVRDRDRIVLTGDIVEGDDTKFAAALDDDVRLVVLGSTGGRVGEAMKIGRLIRRRHLDTAVPSSCMSACALIWAGGVRRSVDGRLAMHCPTFPGELQCYAPTRQVMVDYLKEMGAPTAVIELQEAAGSTSPLWAERAQLAADEGVAPVEDDEGAAPLHDEPPPPRRRPRYHEPPVYGPPPGWIFIPSEQRAMPCLPMLLTFGVLRFCI